MNSEHPATHLNRQTKIIITLGPATDRPNVLPKLIALGVNLVRLNFSHGTQDDHRRRIEAVREEAKKQNRVVGILGDLQGPKIRVSKFKEGKIELKEDALFILDAALDTNAGDDKQVGIDYKELPKDVKTDDILLLDDGRLTLKVNKVEGTKIYTTVIVGGELSNNKGINRRGGGLSAKALTDKDIRDLKFAVKMDVDYLAISFPRNAEDVLETRHLIEQEQGTCGVIAKIERTEAVAEIDGIIEASAGVMVARGDLAVEIGDAQVPWVQKHIIKRALALDKPVIVATQMMESMIYSSVPTRAEVSDVANAVLENADAVMLSAETASGQHPIEAVEAMVRVCLVAEAQPQYPMINFNNRLERRFKRVDEAVAMATMFTANHFDIKGVIALTESGAITLWMSRIRTSLPIFGLSRFPRALGKMSLFRSVYPIEFDVTPYTRDEVNAKAVEFMQKYGVVQDGDKVILTKGDYLGVGGGSNAMKILIVGTVV